MPGSLARQPLVALVTGASRGVGKGVATALGRDGFIVYGTGRSIAESSFDAPVERLVCDHTNDAAVRAVFERIDREQGRLDVLVNNAWGGYEQMVEAGRFTWGLPFWDQPLWRWDAMVDAGIRAAFVASQLGARRMLPARRGLIVHVSHWAAQKHLGNVIYGVAKAATDKLASDMAVELEPHGVTVVSLYPGLVRTEAVLAAGVFDLSNSESPEFIGRVIAALANDPVSMRWTGQVVVAAALAQHYDVTDVDGARPRPLTRADV
jgi:NAD(P)-dependent dehydrogenase (short-subunit alcohol dehydrogenase family)